MLSSTAEYALRIMTVLAEAEGEPLTAEQIAEATRVPSDYAVKVLQWLGRAKMTRGQRGRGGGYRLACDPEATTLLDVVNVVDPLERITACPLGRKEHRHQLCPLHSRIDEVLGLLEDSLGQMTIQSVIEGKRGPALCQPASVGLTISGRRSATRRGKAPAVRRTKRSRSAAKSRKRRRL